MHSSKHKAQRAAFKLGCIVAAIKIYAHAQIQTDLWATAGPLILLQSERLGNCSLSYLFQESGSINV